MQSNELRMYMHSSLLQIHFSQQSIMNYSPFKTRVSYMCSATYTDILARARKKKKKKKTRMIASTFHHTKGNKNVAINI